MIFVWFVWKKCFEFTINVYLASLKIKYISRKTNREVC